MRLKIKSLVDSTFIIIGRFCPSYFYSIASKMKRYMRQNKINFFESPHPQHFDIFARHNLIYPTINLADFHQDQLFNSPLKPHSPTQNPFSQIQHQPSSTQQPFENQRHLSSLECPELMLDEEEDCLTPAEINLKIDFSRQQQEELLIPLTPQKMPVWNQNSLDQNATNRKRNHLQTSPTMSDPRLYERGLKKLAHQAFLFVSSQKKTTYKEVAKKLIGQINDDSQIQTQKKGEMNIKRRVYDALNVLIALGLLKRQGNKILGKVPQEKLSFRVNETEKLNSLQTRQEEMSLEKEQLKKVIILKQQAIADKKKTLEGMKQKIMAIKALEARNKKLLVHREDKISMPFVILCSKEQPVQNATNGQQYLSLFKESNQLTVTFPADKIQLFGDLDLTLSVRGQLLAQRSDRARRCRRG